MRIRSIHARLTLWYTGLLSVTMLLLGGVAYGLLVYSLSHDIDTALRGVASVLGERSRRGEIPFRPPDLDDVFRRFFGFSPWDRYAERRDPLGTRDPRWPPPQSGDLPLTPTARQRAADGLPTFETVEGLGPFPMRTLTWPVVEAGRVTSLIRVGMSLESMAVTRRRFLLVMAAVIPLGLLAAGTGGWLLARRALQPVDRMTEAARRIRAEHLTERLAGSGTGDELDRLAATLNDMLGRLDAAFQQIRQFSADASHELQTPLTILRGELEVALRSPRSPEEYQRVLRSALEECERIAHLVEGLLLLARADAGVLRLDRRAVDLAALLAEVAGQAQVLAQARGITLQLGPVEPATVQADHAHLGRLLLNLVENAIKYTPASGRVTLALHQASGWAEIHVTDTGIGLSPDEQAQIFQRFYRAAEAQSLDARGAGLGLCIAQSIAEAHGGRIQVASAPGRGSTFTVQLPLPPGG